MGKEDIYFGVGTILAIIALLGMDWKLVQGRVPVLKKKEWIYLLLVIASLAFSSFGWYQSRHGLRTFSGPPTIEVRGRDFSNQVVVLDNHIYSHCKFRNVTFKYNGDGPIQMIDNNLEGSIGLDTDDAVVETTFALLRGVGFTNPTIPFVVGPDNTRAPVEPPTGSATPH